MNIPIDDNLPFAEYIKRSKQYIAEQRTDLGGLTEKEKQEIINGNAPFLLKPLITPGKECMNPETGKYKRGILLTHGLTDSPYTLRYIAEFFRQQCFLVYAMLLPGHGTRPGDLLKATWRDWTRMQNYGVQALSEQVENIYLGGNSMGASLGLYQVLNNDSQLIKGLLQFSPSLQISAKANIACLYSAVGKIFKNMAWYEVLPDEDPYKYESFPYHAACQIYKLIQANKCKLSYKALDLPVFIAASKEDITVNTQAMLDFFNQLPNENKHMLLYSSTQDIQVPEHVKIIKSAFPDQKILSYSHLSIVIPPEDEQYGNEADYALCSHYFDKRFKANYDMKKYDQCKQKKEDYLGELTEENMKKGTIRRLTYNPLFKELLNELKGFIDNLPE